MLVRLWCESSFSKWCTALEIALLFRLYCPHCHWAELNAEEKELTVSPTGVLVKQYEKEVGIGKKPHYCVHSTALELLTGTKNPGCESYQGRYIHRTLLHLFKMSREAFQRRWSWSWILNTWEEERKDVLVTGKASADAWSCAPVCCAQELASPCMRQAYGACMSNRK